MPQTGRRWFTVDGRTGKGIPAPPFPRSLAAGLILLAAAAGRPVFPLPRRTGAAQFAYPGHRTRDLCQRHVTGSGKVCLLEQAGPRRHDTYCIHRRRQHGAQPDRRPAQDRRGRRQPAASPSRRPQAREALGREFGVATYAENRLAAAEADVLRAGGEAPDDAGDPCRTARHPATQASAC